MLPIVNMVIVNMHTVRTNRCLSLWVVLTTSIQYEAMTGFNLRVKYIVLKVDVRNFSFKVLKGDNSSNHVKYR